MTLREIANQYQVDSKELLVFLDANNMSFYSKETYVTPNQYQKICELLDSVLKKTYNVLVLGKTGVGKSSFVNYVYQTDAMATGAGKPVTKKGLYSTRYKYNDEVNIDVYDSWGIEANKTGEWEKLILDEVKRRDDSHEISEWFHTMYYCFSASTNRIEEFEYQMINKLTNQGNRISIILTHSDQAKPQEKQNMKDALLKRCPRIKMQDIIEVSNYAKKTLGGKKTETFGRLEVLERWRDNLWLDIRKKLPEQCANISLDVLDDWKAAVKKRIIEDAEDIRKEIHSYDIKEVDQTFNKLFEENFETLQKWVQDDVTTTCQQAIDYRNGLNKIVHHAEEIQFENINLHSNIQMQETVFTGANVGRSAATLGLAAAGVAGGAALAVFTWPIVIGGIGVMSILGGVSSIGLDGLFDKQKLNKIEKKSLNLLEQVYTTVKPQLADSVKTQVYEMLFDLE
ncbi:MAG: GTPase [Culicoidibacterales bacterium]